MKITFDTEKNPVKEAKKIVKKAIETIKRKKLKDKDKKGKK